MLKFRCGSCGKKIAVAEAYQGRRVKCPKCGGVNVAHQEFQEHPPAEPAAFGHSPPAAPAPGPGAAVPAAHPAPAAWPLPELEAESLLESAPPAAPAQADDPADALGQLAAAAQTPSYPGVHAYNAPPTMAPPPGYGPAGVYPVPPVYAPPPQAAYDPGPAPLGYHGAPGYAGSAYRPAPQRPGVNGLGVAALIVGLIAGVAAFVPFCGMLAAIPVGAIGLILGVVGLCLAASNKRSGVGVPIAGSAVSLAAIVLSLVVTVGFFGTAAERVRKEAERQQRQQQNTPFTGFGPSSFPPPPEPPSSPFSGSQDVVTLSEYNRVREGMSYSQVAGIVGSPGQELSRFETDGGGFIPRTTTVAYVWQNPHGSTMSATFQNDRLMTKAQFGLR